MSWALVTLQRPVGPVDSMWGVKDTATAELLGSGSCVVPEGGGGT